MVNSPFRIGLVLYPDVDLLDVAGPNEVFNFFSSLPVGSGVEVVSLAQTIGPIKASGSISVVAGTTFAAAPPLDMIFVPGGGPGIADLINDDSFLAALRQAAGSCRYVTSVCTGGLLLAAAGLLDGYVATTHWSVVDCLALFPRVQVANGCPRFVIDGNRVTGGGISSTIDESLQLVEILATDFSGDASVGAASARQVQLMIQYHPQPTYAGGDPCSVDYSVYAPVRQGMSGFHDAIATAVETRIKTQKAAA